jgi:hypothetical protein
MKTNPPDNARPNTNGAAFDMQTADKRPRDPSHLPTQPLVRWQENHLLTTGHIKVIQPAM